MHHATRMQMSEGRPHAGHDARRLRARQAQVIDVHVTRAGAEAGRPGKALKITREQRHGETLGAVRMPSEYPAQADDLRMIAHHLRCCQFTTRPAIAGQTTLEDLQCQVLFPMRGAIHHARGTGS